MKKLLNLFLCTTAIAGFGIGTSAYAEEAAPQASSTSAEDAGSIVVTARRKEERLQDVPISITVFNQEQLANRNVSNTADLATYTPSLGANTLFGTDNTTFSIRGFVQDVGTAPSVGVYFADVVAPRGGNVQINVGDGAGPGSLFDLENVQVLKGPQGTLFGRNTTGGAILLVPHKPTDKLEGYIEGSLGNYNLRRVQGAINVPVSDSFRLRIGGDRQVRDGYLYNDSAVGPKAFNDTDYWAARLSAVLDVSPNLENYTIASYSRSKNFGSLQKIIACNDTPDPANFLGLQACGLLASQNAKGFWHTSNQVPNPSSDLEQWQVINTTTWKASDSLTVKNIVSYAELKNKASTGLYGTDFYVAPSVPIYFVALFPIPGANTAHQSTLTEELQLQGSLGNGRLDWQAGVYEEISNPLDRISGNQTPVFNSCTDVATFQCVNFTGFGVVNFTGGQIRFRNTGIYGQASYKLNDQLKINGGIRYTWDKTTANSRLITYVFPTYPVIGAPIPYCTNPLKSTLPDCSISAEQKSKAPTWMIGLDYTPTRDVLVYGKWSRGYRTGGVKPDNPSPYDQFAQERVDTYELGAKTTFGGPVRGNLNVSAFYNDFANQQLLVTFNDNPAVPGGISPTSGPVNAGKSRIWGVEVEGSLNPFEGFRLDASYAYLNTKITKIDPVVLPADSPYVAAGSIVAGDELTYSPDHKWSITGTYTVPLDASVGEVSFGATWTHIGQQRYNYADRLPWILAFTGGKDINVQRPVNLLNLNLNWKNIASKPVDLALFVTNLTKEKFYTFTGPIFPATGFETGSVNEPRMFGARLRYRFGN